MEIYDYGEDETDYSLYSEVEWEQFYKRSEIHFARLKEEGTFHTSLLSKLKTVKNPMLLMVGKYDVVTCEKQVQAFHQNAQNGQVIVLEECGHTPHYEKADLFAAAVTNFLK